MKEMLLKNWSWSYENNKKTFLFIIRETYFPKLLKENYDVYGVVHSRLVSS